MTTPKHPPPIKVDLVKQPERESNIIYKWFQHQHGIENLECRIAMLEAELKASKSALKERQELLEIVRAEATGVKEEK